MLRALQPQTFSQSPIVRVSKIKLIHIDMRLIIN